MVEQLNPKEELVVRRFIHPNLIRSMACKRRCYQSVSVLRGQSELHVRLEQLRFQILSVGWLTQDSAFPTHSSRSPAEIRYGFLPWPYVRSDGCAILLFPAKELSGCANERVRKPLRRKSDAVLKRSGKTLCLLLGC